MLTITGVDVRSLVDRGKFVFIAQIGSPEKAVYELRDNSLPCGIGMDLLIRGPSMKVITNSYLCYC